MILVVVYYALVAAVFTLAKQIYSYGSPFFLTSVRMLPAGLAILAFQFIFNRKDLYRPRDGFRYIVAYSLCIVGMDAFRLMAYQYISASNSALLSMIAPLFAAIAAYYMRGERLNRNKVIALCLGTAAVLPMIVSHMKMNIANQWDILLVGYGCMFVSIMSVIFGGIFSKKLTHDLNYPVLSTIGLSLSGAGIFAAVLSLVCETWNPIPLHATTLGLQQIMFLTLIQGCFTFPMYTYLFKKYPVTLLFFFQLLVPVFTAFYVWFLFGETLPPTSIFAFVLLTYALNMFYKQEKADGTLKKANAK